MPESPREGEQPPTHAIVGALGGYPPLGEQLTPDPVPTKRSIWRWLEPLIVGVVVVAVGAAFVIAFVTTPQNEPVARQACTDDVAFRASAPGSGELISEVVVAKGWETRSNAVTAALNRWLSHASPEDLAGTPGLTAGQLTGTKPGFAKNVYLVVGKIDTDAGARQYFLCDVTVSNAKVTHGPETAVTPPE